MSFTPRCGGSLSFRLVLMVVGKSLGVTVKADCFAMDTSVQVKLQDGALRRISPDCSDTLDFGEVSTSHTRYTEACKTADFQMSAAD